MTRSRFHLSSFRCDSVQIFIETCKKFASFCQRLIIQEMECLTCIATQSTSDTAETIHSIGNLDQSGHFLPARQPRPLAVPTCSQKNKQFITRHPATQPEIHQKYSTSSQPSTQPSTLANQTARHALNQSKPWANHALLPSLPSPRSG